MWVERAAKVLRNDAGEPSAEVRARFSGLIAALARRAHRHGPHRQALAHFIKVTRSYWPGLFHAYDVPGLPRTNNDLEHLFGSCRYHERRASGRRRGSEGLVVRGQVRLVAAAATRASSTCMPELAPDNVAAWRALRASLHHRQHGRVLGRRFRRDPDGYLHALEQDMLKLSLPA